MDQRFEEMLGNEVFKAVEPEKINAIRDFVQNNQGKNINGIFGEIIKLNSVLNKGRPLSPKEKEAMLEVVLTTLNKEERDKFMCILNLMEKGF